MIPGTQEWTTAGLVVRLGLEGRLEGSVATTGAVLVAAAGDLELEGPDGPLVLGPPTVEADAEEVEVTRVGPGVRAVVRHSFEQGWTVRVLLVATGDVPLPLRSAHLGWRAGPGTVVTALAAGAAAVHAVQPDDGAGPVLVGRLRSGTQPGVDERGLRLGPVVLEPGHRWAAQWRWEPVAAPRLADPTGAFPRSVWLEEDQPVLLPSGPDVAVVAPGLEVEQDEHGVRLEASATGPATVELRSARGTTTYALSWAPSLDDAVDVEVAALLAGPTTPAGTVRLPDAAGALLVQDALRRRALASPEPAVEALELAAGLLVDEIDELERLGSAQGATNGPATAPFAAALLAREADREPGPGARAALRAAAAAVLATRVPTVGTGLAGVAVALARVRAAEPGAEETVDHLARLAGSADARDAAGLELGVLLGAGTDVVEPGLRRLGALLGAGLPGRVVPEPELEVLAHATTVLALADEATGQRLRRGWGITTSELARRAGAQVRARVAQERDPVPARRALAWLVLGPPG